MTKLGFFELHEKPLSSMDINICAVFGQPLKPSVDRITAVFVFCR
jgi:hypothetical protein